MPERLPSTITVPRPHVLNGPVGVPTLAADAEYMRSAARNVRNAHVNGRSLWGSTVTGVIEKMLEDAAAALDSAHAAQVAQEEKDANPRPRGWWFPTGSRKAHAADAEGRSYCGRYGSWGVPEEAFEPLAAAQSPDDCAACRRKVNALIEKERSRG